MEQVNRKVYKRLMAKQTHTYSYNDDSDPINLFGASHKVSSERELLQPRYTGAVLVVPTNPVSPAFGSLVGTCDLLANFAPVSKPYIQHM